MGKTKHGVGSIKLTKHHKFSAPIRRETQLLREKIIEDVGGLERMTGVKIVLMDRAVSMYAMIRTIENYIKKTGVISGDGKLEPILANNYLAFVNSLRLTLREIGVEKKSDDLLTPEIWSESAEDISKKAKR